MKQTLLLFILAMLTSCEQIHYDGETRLVFQTVVKDANGQPLPNTHVEIRPTTGYASDLISKGKTNENGEITLLFPAPDGDAIDINLKFYNDDNTYMERETLNLSRADFVNYKFVFPDTYLLKNDEVALLNVIYNQTNPAVILRKVTIQGIYSTPEEYYHVPQDDDYYYDYSFLMPSPFFIKKNQSFQLKYTTLNLQTNVHTQQFVDLQIGNDNIDYTLNY
ncbi:Ig-like domain-containing protein [Flavobacterium terrisoli]|uniref:Ig-like domain-containing protein n=1 Tax=Flavobacterium terrisoli TaxID=3242195 RepID=UPI00254359AD|nr:Ig-like domain-containing protein [Flavobacterium buctense]